MKQKLMEQNMMANLEVVKKEENDFFPCSPHSFRHWFACILYHHTNNTHLMKEKLFHKSLLTTQIYVEMYTQIYGDIKPERYVSKVAEIKEQKLRLINDGWEFVQKDNDGCWYFRKPK